MTTDEILKKLESLLELQRKFRTENPDSKNDDLFRFQRDNGWPIVTELQTPLGGLTVLDKDNNKIPFWFPTIFGFGGFIVLRMLIMKILKRYLIMFRLC